MQLNLSSHVKYQMTRTISFFLLVLIISCDYKRESYSPVQNRDSIMTKYFQAVDSLPYTDTLEYDFKLLKAYYKGDTAFLKISYDNITELLKHRDKMREYHICEEPPALTTLKYEEAFRFSYGAAFCNKSVNLTIGKSGDSITLDFYLYEFNYEFKECKTIQHDTRNIDKQIWDTLIRGIRQADFWGLKEDNGNHGLDGSGLLVSGYERPINAFKGRYKTIYRWAAEEMAIGVLFKTVLDLAGIKVDCFRYN